MMIILCLTVDSIDFERVVERASYGGLNLFLTKSIAKCIEQCIYIYI